MPDFDVLTVNVGTGNPEFVEIGVEDPRSTHDFELVVYGPNAVAAGKATQEFEGIPYLSADPARKLGQALNRRQDEFRALVDAGGDLLIFADEQKRFFLNSTAISSGWDIVPTPGGWKAAAGSKVTVTDTGPLGDFLRSRVSDISYRASFEIEFTDWKPLALISSTGEAVGAVWEDTGSSGRIILLPFMRHAWSKNVFDEGPYQGDGFWQSLIHAVRSSRVSAEDLPEWAGAYAGRDEQDLVSRAGELRKQISAAQEDLAAVEASRRDAAQPKALLYSQGSELERAVDLVFSAWGGVRLTTEPNRADHVFEFGDWIAVVEVKGLAGSAKESNAAQLEKWASDWVDSEKRVKPVLIVNGYRQVDPRDRDHTFPAQMVPYSERREHVLLTSSQLFAMYELGRAEPSAIPTMLTEISDSIGLLPGHEIASFRWEPPHRS